MRSGAARAIRDVCAQPPGIPDARSNISLRETRFGPQSLSAGTCHLEMWNMHSRDGKLVTDYRPPHTIDVGEATCLLPMGRLIPHLRSFSSEAARFQRDIITRFRFRLGRMRHPC
jgi:hypothetical protein